MEDKAKIKVSTIVQFGTKTYVPGKEYEVSENVVRSLGSIAEVIEKVKSSVPTDEELKEKMEKKNKGKGRNKNKGVVPDVKTVMAPTDENVETK